jgi:hypothetical protein
MQLLRVPPRSKRPHSSWNRSQQSIFEALSRSLPFSWSNFLVICFGMARWRFVLEEGVAKVFASR